MTGNELASVVHEMLRDVNTAVSIPLIVSRAAKGDYGPLEHAGSGDLHVGLDLMGSSIWCNEPWAGLDATGPWGTAFDGYTSAYIAEFRRECSSVAKRDEPRSLWRLPTSSHVPVLALVGGADPQDPVTNLPDLKRHFPDSRIVVLPHLGHELSWDGACDTMLADFVARRTTWGLDTTSCVREVMVPAFELGD
jgi:pimeloyl-ACP methyl ester carboxylesterase